MAKLCRQRIDLAKLLFFFCLLAIQTVYAEESKQRSEVLILGIAQDAGYPQINCYQPHCLPAWADKSKRRLATSFAVIDHLRKEKYLFEATPDIKEQLFQLHQVAPDSEYRFGGVFLTHAHIGHYTGLMQFGREAASTNMLPVYAMPKMKHFLASNGPWSQLVTLKNIQLKPLLADSTTQLNAELKVTPLTVPHRDEYSETVGFIVQGPRKSLLFIPDIDKWQKWRESIITLVKKVDFALIDATFFADGELANRNMSEVPHPFVEETMTLLSSLSAAQKQKVIFIHFNHTNPLLRDGSEAQKKVLKAGYRFAVEGMRLAL